MSFIDTKREFLLSDAFNNRFPPCHNI